MNLRCGLVVTVIICGLNILNLTIDAWAAEVPFVDRIAGKVQVSIFPVSPTLRSLIHEVNTEEIIDHQFDGHAVFDGHVSVIFLDNWKSASTVLGKKLDLLTVKLLKQDPKDIAFGAETVVSISDVISPYLHIFYNMEAVDNISKRCIAKDIVNIIQNSYSSNIFNITKCLEEE